MKDEWKKPEMKILGIYDTKSVEPIIRQWVEGEIAPALEANYGWKCPCCSEESGYIYTSEEAKNDFFRNHLNSCAKYNKVTDSCIIS